MGFPVFQFVPTASYSGTGQQWKRHGSIDVYRHWQDPLRASYFLGWLSTSLYSRGAPIPWSSWWLYAGLFPICPHFSCAEGDQSECSTPRAVSSMLGRGKGRVSLHCLMKPRILLVFLAARAYFWLVFNLIPTRPPGSFLQSCFPSVWPLSCRILLLALLEVQCDILFLPIFRDFPPWLFKDNWEWPYNNIKQLLSTHG